MSSSMNQLGFGMSILKRLPFNVLIQVTNRCNYKCSFCDFWPNGVHPRLELTLQDYQKLSTDLKKVGTFLVSIEGGEPFARKDLIEIVRAFSKHHLPVLYTNGWYVTAENARELFENGLHQVGVSIDFSTPALHDQKRGQKGAYDKAVAALQFFKQAAPKGEKQVHIMSVMMRENQDDIENLLKLSQNLGVGHFFTLLSKKGFRRGKGNDDQLPEPGFTPRLNELFFKYPHFRAFRGYLDGIDAFLSNGELPDCRAGLQSFNIDHLGGVSSCIEKIDQPLGNIRELPFTEILQNLKHSGQSKGCQDCWTLCRSFGQNLGMGGNMRSWKDLVTRM
jgi:MoaA/NifB/PqqE/SkfB family radical SAM enzyme